MFPQVRTQDLLLQNQSMRLVEETLDASNANAVLLAKVRYLQSVLPTPIIGTAGVVLMFYLLGVSLNRPFEFLVWLALGLLTTGWRLILLLRYKNLFASPLPTQQLKSYLTQTTHTAVIAGAPVGWGWLNIYAHLSPEIQMGFLFTNIVMLFGGLYAYSPHLPAYVSFSVVSLVPALWQVQQNATLWIAQTVGIALVVLVSQMFAFRWAQNFRHNVLLQEKNAKLLDELTEKKDLAEKATRAKSRFLASVSHDLRQPLHAINLYLAVLKRSLEPNSKNANTHDQQAIAMDNLHHLQDSATQLTHMFEALLDISKLDAGTTRPQISFTPIASMIRQLTHEFAQVAAQFDLAFDSKLPANLDQMYVLTDVIMLERMLRNLLANATSHTQHGGVRLRLLLKNKGGDDCLEFRVIDTGPGIRRAERNRIFEEFYQTDAARKQASLGHKSSQNLGLGLAITSRLASLLSTRIRLHSQEGKGSVFAFDLPMHHNTHAIEKSTWRDFNHSPLYGHGLHDKFFVIVDDDPLILDATDKLLTSYGARVLTAESSAQAWETLADALFKPDVFLVDHRLNNESGLDLIHTIQQRYGKSEPCILITGDTSAEHVEAFNQSHLRVLYKPLTDQSLIEAIYDVLGLARDAA
jgi:signal transduction histidine kinase/CheY-like chemotaxis protein